MLDDKTHPVFSILDDLPRFETAPLYRYGAIDGRSELNIEQAIRQVTAVIDKPALKRQTGGKRRLTSVASYTLLGDKPYGDCWAQSTRHAA